MSSDLGMLQKALHNYPNPVIFKGNLQSRFGTIDFGTMVYIFYTCKLFCTLIGVKEHGTIEFKGVQGTVSFKGVQGTVEFKGGSPRDRIIQGRDRKFKGVRGTISFKGGTV